MEEIEQVLFVARECQVFKIPPRTSTAGYQAAGWSDLLIWRGRLRVIETTQLGQESGKAVIRLEDKDSGDLFASCPYDDANAVEPVLDSSRYFVLRVVDPTSGAKAYLGMGFEERTDAFDFNVALQEFTRRRKGQSSSAKTSSPSDSQAKAPPPMDFSLKEGETISISFGGMAPPKSHTSNSTSQQSGSGPIPLLPPPPSANSVRRKNT